MRPPPQDSSARLWSSPLPYFRLLLLVNIFSDIFEFISYSIFLCSMDCCESAKMNQKSKPINSNRRNATVFCLNLCYVSYVLCVLIYLTISIYATNHSCQLSDHSQRDSCRKNFSVVWKKLPKIMKLIRQFVLLEYHIVYESSVSQH